MELLVRSCKSNSSCQSDRLWAQRSSDRDIGFMCEDSNAMVRMPTGYADFMPLHVDQQLKPLTHSADNRCFGCGPANPTGLRLEFLVAEDGTVVSLPEVPSAFEGHPGFLHGGIIATLLDEAMSKAVRAVGYSSVTAKIEVEYRRPVPSGVRLHLEGRVVSSEGRKHWTKPSSPMQARMYRQAPRDCSLRSRQGRFQLKQNNRAAGLGRPNG